MAFIPPMIAAVSAAMPAMSTIATVASIGSTALGAYGSMYQANAAAAAQEYNAKVKEMEAKNFEDQAAYKAAEIVRKSRVSTTEAVAKSVESGFEFTGSIADLAEQSLKYGHLDALSAVYEGRVRAYGKRVGAQQDLFEAGGLRTAGKIGAASKVLSGVADIYKMRTQSGSSGYQQAQDF